MSYWYIFPAIIIAAGVWIMFFRPETGAFGRLEQDNKREMRGVTITPSTLPPPDLWKPCDQCSDPMDCGSWMSCKRGHRT